MGQHYLGIESTRKFDASRSVSAPSVHTRPNLVPTKTIFSSTNII